MNMNIKQFIGFSLGVFVIGILYSYLMNKSIKEYNQPKTKITKIEYNEIKSVEYKTRYGDTMVVTVDTTYYNIK
jgi:hypothetical protein